MDMDQKLRLLRDAAAWRYAGVDLRFEGGPWVSLLDELLAEGLVSYSEGEPAYMVSYTITDKGRALLS